MLIQIGDSKQSSDIVDLLLECHQRIRYFAGLALRVANAEGSSPDEVRDAAKRLIRYFSESLPLHVADEEKTILPRLSGRNGELDSALQAMQQEHMEHEPYLQELLNISSILSTAPERLDEVRQALRTTAAILESEFLEHLEKEERIILPAIRAVLAAEEREVMLSELRARR